MPVSMDLISRLIKEVEAAHCPDMPLDAKVVRAYHLFDFPGKVVLEIESESFDEVSEGACPPYFTPIYLRGPSEKV